MKAMMVGLSSLASKYSVLSFFGFDKKRNLCIPDGVCVCVVCMCVCL